MNQKRKERKISPTFIVISIIGIIGVSFLIYTLHSFKRIYRISFSDDRTIVSDGAGPYSVVSGVSLSEDGVQFSEVYPLIIELKYSNRLIKSISTILNGRMKVWWTHLQDF